MKMSVTLRQHFWKTKLCPLHMENRCKEGNNCDYAHSIEDLRSIPDLKRTKLCYKLLKGEKCFNKKCNYAHNQEELKSAQNLFAYKSSMCKFVANKTCLNGSTCRFAHTIDELRVPRIPEILLEKNNLEVEGENDSIACVSGRNIINELNNNGDCINKENAESVGSMHRSTNERTDSSINESKENITQKFTKNFDLILNNFQSMQITQNEHRYNNTNYLKNYSTNSGFHRNTNNRENNHKDEKKRKDKNRNKEKQLKSKLKKFNYVKNYEHNLANYDAVPNSYASSSNKMKSVDERYKFYDSNTTISSSLNCAKVEKNEQMNDQAYVGKTFEKVDLNEYYGKTEECIRRCSKEKSAKGNADECVKGSENQEREGEGCVELSYNKNRCNENGGNYKHGQVRTNESNKNKSKKRNDTKNYNVQKNAPTCDIINGKAGNGYMAHGNTGNCHMSNDNATSGNTENSNVPYPTNNKYMMNGQENQINYTDYNYNNYVNPLIYNKVMQMKFNAFNPYINYNQVNNSACKYDGAIMSNHYQHFMKPNEYFMYDHQTNIQHMTPNYYANYLYFYANPYNYDHCARTNKMKNADNSVGEKFISTGNQKQSVPKKATHLMEFNKSNDRNGNEENQGDKTFDKEHNYWGTYEEELDTSEEVSDEDDESCDEFVGGRDNDGPEISREERVNVTDETENGIENGVKNGIENEVENKVENEVENGTENEIENEKENEAENEIENETGIDPKSEQLEKSTHHTQSRDGNTNTDLTKAGKIKKNKEHIKQCSVSELRGKNEHTKENMNICIKKSYHGNANNNNAVIETSERNKFRNGNLNDERVKHTKSNMKHKKNKMSNFVPLNNNENKNYNRNICLSNEETVYNTKRNDNNIENIKQGTGGTFGNSTNAKSTKNAQLQFNAHANPSSVYSYILNASNTENTNCEKRFMKPSSTPMDLYLNNQYHMNQLANEHMMYNLNNRNYGYYYCPYVPSDAYNDEVYLN
ncbi:hypothetical protein, conserved [Plasmodium gonderi]|uniref:C3H1-type domain-containing protein n=1 Tax=Plasmodium gonderi TaxID=77519 RepID=A0A1Y1JHF1_PLAGO|nr:hypothetical protein, conserved [Plasmodium gonderi]GAW81670.1 hypothetical protein, conserved [Plasmodium gonderi]